MYIDKTVKEYLNDLAAKTVVPGGGSASALIAATGTSLMSMVANFTIGKPEHKAVEDRVVDILQKTQKFSSELCRLVDADADAYKKLSAGLKEPIGDIVRRDLLYKDASTPPLLVCEISAKCMRLCRSLVECGNKNLITDTAIAAILFEAAFLSAKFNVYINLKEIKDTDYIAKVHNGLKELEEEMPKLKDQILELCEDVIST